MQITSKLLTVWGGLLYLLIIVFQPSLLDASTLVHTVQVGSFEDIEGATRQYNFVIDRINKDALDNLRIEKIGQFYSVRLGKFIDPVNAKNLHKTVKHLFSSPVLMKAYIKDERIIKRYSHTSSMNKEKEIDDPSSSRKFKIPIPPISDKIKEGGDRLFYTIQIGSFIPLDRARNEYASVIQKLFDKTPDHLRIEKIGTYNSVRIGKFATYVSAEKYLSSVKAHFSSAFIIQAYIKDKRIVMELKKDPSQKEKGITIETKSFNSITPVHSSHNAGSNDQSEQYSMLPVSDKLTLRGIVIMDNVRFAIIEDSDLNQSGLYNLNEQIGEFVVSDILENTVILNKKDTMIKLLLWEGNSIALSSPEPDLSQEIKSKSSQGNRRGKRERINRLLNKIGTSNAQHNFSEEIKRRSSQAHPAQPRLSPQESTHN